MKGLASHLQETASRLSHHAGLACDISDAELWATFRVIDHRPMLRGHTPSHARHAAWTSRQPGRRRVGGVRAVIRCKATDVRWLAPSADAVQTDYDAIIVLAGMPQVSCTYCWCAAFDFRLSTSVGMPQGSWKH